SQSTAQSGAPGVSLLGRRRASPVPTSALPPFHAPYAAGFFGAAPPSPSPLPWPSPLRSRLGSPLSRLSAGPSFDAADFASCYGPVSCTLPLRARPRASTHRSLRTPTGCYKGGLVPPLAGLPPASRCRLQDAPRSEEPRAS